MLGQPMDWVRSPVYLSHELAIVKSSSEPPRRKNYVRTPPAGSRHRRRKRSLFGVDIDTGHHGKRKPVSGVWGRVSSGVQEQND